MGKTTPSKPGVRNLQAIKGGSFTVTLPRWWVTKHTMSKGAKIFLVEDGVSLKLAPMSLIAETRRATINVEDFEDVPSLRYPIWTYYMQGADEILVKSREVMSPNTKQRLREIRMDLSGIEILREDSYSILFGVNPGQEQRLLDDMIRDLQATALSIHKDSINALVSRKPAFASEIITREPEVLRSYRAMIRKLAICSVNSKEAYSSGIKDSRELITYGLLARDLNRTVYHSIYIARHIVKFGEQMDQNILQLLRRMSDITFEMQKLAVEAFLERDYTKTIRVIKLTQGIKKIDDTISSQIFKNTRNVKKAVTQMLIAREIRRIAGYSVGMADAAANRIFFPKVAM